MSGCGDTIPESTHALSDDGPRAIDDSSDLDDREIGRLLDANVCGVAIGDAQGGINDVNDAFMCLHGYTRNELLQGFNWKDLTPPDWKSQITTYLGHDYERGFLATYRTEHLHKTGYRIPLGIGAKRIRGSDLIICTAVDLSPQLDPRSINPQAAFFAAQRRFRLTVREHAVLSYLIEGMANTEIAAALMISPATVNEYVQNVMRKVGVHKRSQLFKRVLLE
jgi:PAS domain S-box-containing protein